MSCYLCLLSGGAPEERGRGLAHLPLRPVVRTLYGCATGSAAGRQEVGKTGGYVKL